MYPGAPRESEARRVFQIRPQSASDQPDTLETVSTARTRADFALSSANKIRARNGRDKHCSPRSRKFRCRGGRPETTSWILFTSEKDRRAGGADQWTIAGGRSCRERLSRVASDRVRTVQRNAIETVVKVARSARDARGKSRPVNRSIIEHRHVDEATELC